jgi:hypothetical protein
VLTSVMSWSWVVRPVPGGEGRKTCSPAERFWVKLHVEMG